jgi:N-acetylmuramate 1-kinase
MNQDHRLQQLCHWASQQTALNIDAQSLRPASSDASFRRYFRADAGNHTLILMDAPPDKEDSALFLDRAEVLAATGISVPRIFASDHAMGFLALEDFGSTPYLDALNTTTAPALYAQAIRSLIQMQANTQTNRLPGYDRAMLKRELDLYPQWYVAQHKKWELDDSQQQVLSKAFELIIERCVSQPQVYVHRDFHSRNLMVIEQPRSPGIIDFQDALIGPVTYDLASLFRDAYIVWDEAQQLDWLIRYWEQAKKAGVPVNSDFGEFYTQYEWMGLQRHFKVLGIFARLNYRDGKARYLNDLPVVLEYTMKVLRRYVELGPLLKLVEVIENHQQQVGYTF